MILQINDNIIDNILEQYSENLLLIDFWSARCESCRLNAAIADELSRETCEHVVIGKVNTDESPYIISRFCITIIPSMALIYKKKKINEFCGVVNSNDIFLVLNQYG